MRDAQAALFSAADALAKLADEAPALHDCLCRCLSALVGGQGDAEADDRRRRRQIQSALAPLARRLRAQPADARRLARWLFHPDRAWLDHPGAWQREFPGLPPPRADAVTALMEVAIGLLPLPDDDAMLREWQARQGRHDREQIIGHPSPYAVIRDLARLVDLGPGEYLCDLGAGHGRVVLALALLGIPARGIELLPDRRATAERARRALRIEEARFDLGNVLDERFWHGPEAIAAAGWHYCYDPFDAATHTALLARLRALARRPTRLIALIQTSRYHERYQQALAEGVLRAVGPPAARLAFGLQVFELAE